MTGMANLHTDLRNLINSHLPSKNQDVQDILMELTILLREASAYQYRNHPRWDTTWLELDESQLATVLKQGHTVERRLTLGDWEAVTEEAASVSH